MRHLGSILMKISHKIITASLMFFTGNSFASKEILSTHVYNNFAIQSVGISNTNDKIHADEIIISKSRFLPNPVSPKLFNIPKIDSSIWTITAKDLHVTEEACLEIDALLCRDYKEMYQSSEAMCYDTCISNGPYFVAYDALAKRVYIDAGTNVSGTGGTPEFLFVADIDKKQIKYLNTVVAPYEAYLSTKGTYIAISQGYNGIEIFNTHTGNKFVIHGKSADLTKKAVHPSLGNIRWLNDTELQYEDIYYDDKFPRVSHATTKNIFNIVSKKIVKKKIMK
jgi:hypothetical protein